MPPSQDEKPATEWPPPRIANGSAARLGQAERADHVGGARRPEDDGRSPVEHAVEDHARIVVVRMIRFDDLPPEAFTKLTQRVGSRAAELAATAVSVIASPCRRRSREPTPLERQGGARMRLNAWLARAGVASRRASDELIKAGRVTVNGCAGPAEHGRRRRRRGAARRAAARAAGARVRPAAQAGGRDHDRARSAGTADRRQPRQAPGARRPGRAARRRDDRRAAADERRRARTPLAHPKYEVEKVYVAELDTRASDATLAKLAAGVQLEDGPTAPAAGAPARPDEARADDPRGPQPPGAADVRGGRPPRPAACTAAATAR